MQFGQHDIRRDQPAIARIVTLEERDHGAGREINHPAAGRPAGLNHVGGRLVGVDAVGHAADDGILVGLLGQERQHLANPDAGHIGLDRLGERAAVIVAGAWLRVERIEVGGAAPDPDLDDGLGFRLCCRRGGAPGSGRGGLCRVQAVRAQPVGQQQTCCAQERPLHRFTPGEAL